MPGDIHLEHYVIRILVSQKCYQKTYQFLGFKNYSVFLIFPKYIEQDFWIEINVLTSKFILLGYQMLSEICFYVPGESVV